MKKIVMGGQLMDQFFGVCNSQFNDLQVSCGRGKGLINSCDVTPTLTSHLCPVNEMPCSMIGYRSICTT